MVCERRDGRFEIDMLWALMLTRWHRRGWIARVHRRTRSPRPSGSSRVTISGRPRTEVPSRSARAARSPSGRLTVRRLLRRQPVESCRPTQFLLDARVRRLSAFDIDVNVGDVLAIVLSAPFLSIRRRGLDRRWATLAVMGVGLAELAIVRRRRAS